MDSPIFLGMIIHIHGDMTYKSVCNCVLVLNWLLMENNVIF